MEFCLIVPDCHIPFENRHAFELMLQVARTLKIKMVVLLGDFLDKYGLSFYEKDPSFGDLAELYDREIQCGKVRIRQVEKLGASRFVFCEGNHEFRMIKYLRKFAPAVRNRLGVPQELELENHWKWVPFGRFQKYQIPGTDIFCRHSPPVGGSAQNVAKQSGDTIIHGHTHQSHDSTFVTKVSRRQIRCVSSGWLGLESERVFDFVVGQPDWSLMFTLVSSARTIHPIHIKRNGPKYYCVFGEKLYQL